MCSYTSDNKPSLSTLQMVLTFVTSLLMSLLHQAAFEVAGSLSMLIFTINILNLLFNSK